MTLKEQVATLEQRVAILEGCRVGYQNELQRISIIAQKAEFKVDTMRDMYERKYKLDVAAGVAEAVAAAARARATSAARHARKRAKR